MNKDDILKKLKNFRQEIEDCQSVEEFKVIEERLKRYIGYIYLDDDPFVKRCKSRWSISPSTLQSLENVLW